MNEIAKLSKYTIASLFDRIRSSRPTKTVNNETYQRLGWLQNARNVTHVTPCRRSNFNRGKYEHARARLWRARGFHSKYDLSLVPRSMHATRITQQPRAKRLTPGAATYVRREKDTCSPPSFSKQHFSRLSKPNLHGICETPRQLAPWFDELVNVGSVLCVGWY